MQRFRCPHCRTTIHGDSSKMMRAPSHRYRGHLCPGVGQVMKLVSAGMTGREFSAAERNGKVRR